MANESSQNDDTESGEISCWYLLIVLITKEKEMPQKGGVRDVLPDIFTVFFEDITSMFPLII